jgi:cytochrome b subunit of formate dehydrogenase
MPQHPEKFVRFKLAQRIEHIVLIASFSTLAVTGLVQKYSLNPYCDAIIQALGGIENTRLIHHAAAVVFVLQTLYHFILLAYKLFVQHTELTMLPGIRDLTDALGELSYNVGLAKRRPAMPRYNYVEKVEYWAMIWGTLIMAATGFMLWNPIFITKMFPGQIIPAAKAAHGGEAVLAVLAIFIWHMYSVHLKRFNKAMWTGKMSREEMEEEHAEELARLERGDLRPLPSPEVVHRRQWVFFPVMIPITLLLVGGVVWLTRFEKTAITTVPAHATVQVFVPLPTGTPASSVVTSVGAAIPHDLAGKEQCDTCHGQGQIKPYPADHVGRPNESCQACHKPGPASTAAPPAGQASGSPNDIPHPIAGREKCEMCHASGGIKPMPADHAGRTSDTCTTCHKLSPGISGTPQAAATPETAATSAAGTTPTVEAGTTPTAEGAAAPTAGAPMAIPHDITGDLYKDCTTCHGAGKIKPFPASHAAYTTDMCTGCHKPAGAGGATGTGQAAATPAAGATAAAATAPIMPANHDLTSSLFKDNCLSCHAAGKMKPFPASHASYTVDTCTTCHKAAGG